MKLTIGNKIFLGFLTLIILSVINAGIIFYVGSQIDQVRERSSEVIRPSKDAIGKFELLVTRSKMLIINWVYVQSNTDDKNALKNLHEFEYPDLKEEIIKLSEQWDNEKQKLQMDTVITEFEDLLKKEQEVMSQLVTFENYEDPLTKLLAEDAIESQVIPMTTSIIERLNEVTQSQQDASEQSDIALEAATTKLRYFTVLLGIASLILGLVAAAVMSRMITRPINYMKELVLKLGKGELVEDKGRSFNNDEIGEMATAMDQLIDGLRSTTDFAENIGKGQYDSEYKPLSESDVLGNALIDMRDNLSRVAEEDKKRNWSTEGLAKFGDILRNNNDNIEKLSDDIVRNLVKYLGANQGGIYIIDDKTGDEPFMTMTACYAWDKKKYIEQKVYIGEGLAGQVWLEKDTIYLTEVPSDYIKITSGLGDANPKSVLIVPLKVNEDIYGVVEIASFKEFADYEVEFVEKIAESIASTVSTVKINATTQKLLEESQEMTEQMRSQEEEMRQNMEELQATQEEMQRGQVETENTMEAINEGIGMVEFSPEGEILNVNKAFLDIVGYSKADLVGEHHRILVSKEEKTSDAYKQFWRDLSHGASKRGEFKRVSKSGNTVYISSSYSPIKKRDGSVGKVMKFAVDITHLKKEPQES